MRDARSVVDVVSDIFGNLEDIVHAEIRLAKAEVTHEIRGLKSRAAALGVALVAVLFTVLFVLLSAMYALTAVLKPWGAALVVAGVAAVISIVAFAVRSRHALIPDNIAPRTTQNIKENLEWAKQSNK